MRPSLRSNPSVIQHWIDSPYGFLTPSCHLNCNEGLNTLNSSVVMNYSVLCHSQSISHMNFNWDVCEMCTSTKSTSKTNWLLSPGCATPPPLRALGGKCWPSPEPSPQFRRLSIVRHQIFIIRCPLVLHCDAVRRTSV
jgi:hypothetical protein